MRVLSSRKMGVLVCALTAALLAQPAQAAQQTLSSALFDVTYDDALVALYGQPILVGQTLIFTPTAMLAESLNGHGLVELDADLSLTIKPHTGYALDTLSFTQRGDYLVRGTGSTVNALGTVTVSSLAKPAETLSASMVPAAALNQADAVNHNWSATETLVLNGALPSGASQGVSISLDHSLAAFTDAASAGRRRAMIQEKFSSLDVSVHAASTVPEPGELVLAMGGLLAVWGLRRRVR
jgi:MYXO-CTERM domain-containing protein